MLRVVLCNICKLTFVLNSLSETYDSGSAVTSAVGSGPVAKQSASPWVAFPPPETGTVKGKAKSHMNMVQHSASCHPLMISGAQRKFICAVMRWRGFLWSDYW